VGRAHDPADAASAMKSAGTFAQKLVFLDRNHLLWEILNQGAKSASEKGRRNER
jgi:hypothetical protein